MTKQYVGNCVNSFTEDGDCIVMQLPYYTVSDFACNMAEADLITAEEFFDNVPKSVVDMLRLPISSDFEYYKDEDDVFMIYDCETDIHYFFV